MLRCVQISLSLTITRSVAPSPLSGSIACTSPVGGSSPRPPLQQPHDASVGIRRRGALCRTPPFASSSSTTVPAIRSPFAAGPVSSRITLRISMRSERSIPVTTMSRTGSGSRTKPTRRPTHGGGGSGRSKIDGPWYCSSRYGGRFSCEPDTMVGLSL